MSIEKISSNINWLGHDSMRIDAENGAEIYFDPYQIGPQPEADLIFITHDHFDHCSVEDVAKIQGEKTVIITEKDSAEKLSGDVRVVSPGDTLAINGINIEVVSSYNIDKDFHPKNNNWLGFIVEIDGVRIYHAGDSDFIPEMKEINTDIALLPVSGTYVMTAEEAIDAALAINPKLAIPMHYGSIVGDDSDAQKFKQGLKGRIDVRICEKV